MPLFADRSVFLAIVAVIVEILFMVQYIVMIIILARAVRLDGPVDHVTGGLLAVQIANALGLLWIVWILLKFVNGLLPITPETLVVKLAIDAGRIVATTYFMYYLLRGRSDG